MHLTPCGASCAIHYFLGSSLFQAHSRTAYPCLPEVRCDHMTSLAKGSTSALASAQFGILSCSREVKACAERKPLSAGSLSD